MDASEHTNTLAWFEQKCRESGLALTVQRRTILSTLLECGDHPSADQVYERVRERIPGLSRTTVYRVLDTLVRVGAVGRVAHPGSAARYDPKTHRHHHFVCIRCSQIIDFEDRRLDQIVLPDLDGCGLEIQDFNLHLRGVCATCRADQPVAAPATALKTPRRGKNEKPPTRQSRRKSS